MDTKVFCSCILYIFSILVIYSIHVSSQANIFNVNKFGAISNGSFDNKQIFLATWKKACETSGGVFLVPQGTYLFSGAQFGGPCIGQTIFTINGYSLATSNVTLDNDYWISFESVNGLTINGGGTFDGNGTLAWSRSCKDLKTCKLPPTSLAFDKVLNAQIQDIKSKNSKMFHMSIYASKSVTLNNVTASAPADSPNTDGVHIARSSDIKIINSHIATGDDCISIGDGSSNVNITGIFCGPGHGISIGSLGKYPDESDVSLITVTNCTLTNTTNGLRIKSFESPISITAHDLTYRDIIMNNVKNPIIIDQHYCIGNCTKKDQGESSVQIKTVKFIDVRGSSITQDAVTINCSRNKPCQGIEFSGLNLNIRGQPTTAVCSNVEYKFLGSNQVPSMCRAPVSSIAVI